MGTRVIIEEEDVNKYTIGDKATSLSDFYVIYLTHKISEAYKKILSAGNVEIYSLRHKIKEAN